MVLRCQIRVRGHLSRDWREWFDDLTVANMPDGEALFFGGLPDQAALFGLLSRIQRAGLPVVSMHCVSINDD
jgi:enamine deaminase RidA (YjgF/YER057c/UK114 family)